jgi:hypothetical protein
MYLKGIDYNIVLSVTHFHALDTVRVTNLRRKKYQMTCLGFTLYLPPETRAISGA